MASTGQVADNAPIHRGVYAQEILMVDTIYSVTLHRIYSLSPAEPASTGRVRSDLYLFQGVSLSNNPFYVPIYIRKHIDL